jgi:hypothetical protein
LKVFGGGLRTKGFIVPSRIAYSARREQRADRASAAFYTGQERGSNEILEKRCALCGQSRPAVRVAYPLIAPLRDFTDKDTNGTNNLLLINASGVESQVTSDLSAEPVNAG